MTRIQARVRAQNRAILRPILAEIASTCGEFDPVGFGDPRQPEDYRAWGDPDMARKLAAESPEYGCPYCGRARCAGIHPDCNSYKERHDE